MWYQQVMWRSSFRAPALELHHLALSLGVVLLHGALLSLQPRGETESKERPTNH